ncbi:methylmalonyl-CoA mutase [Halalkalibacter sp. AB-rgal2]|uniref:methylmalonyl-CoA mutase n=1 Tax=Halalkalibacter sp. AB-rgal2 TaxID=3242695 RepID=UPI00359E407E
MIRKAFQRTPFSKIERLYKQELHQEETSFFYRESEACLHLESYPGNRPFVRGPYPTMYKKKPWTIRQYGGFSTVADSNRFYRECLKDGQTGLSIAFDLATHRGYDSDHPAVVSDVGKAGVAIDTVEDMIELFAGIPLDQISVSMTMNGAVLPIMAFFIVAAEKYGVDKKKLKGTIQNDILKEYLVRNTYIYPPKASMDISTNIMSYLAHHVPFFNSVSVSGYHMQEAGAPAELELAYTICNGMEYVKAGIGAGLNVDQFAPRLSFFWGIGMNFFEEIAKLRAARLLWSNVMERFQPTNEHSFRLRAHSQTSGWSLTAQAPYNNLVRTTIEAMAAVIGHTQSLHTNAYDEALALPSRYSAKLARQTQQFLLDETGLTDVIDPFGGSYYVESLTTQLYNKAWKHISEIERNGGMVKAILTGIPQKKIALAATERQAAIDTKQEAIIGLNKHTSHRERTDEKLLYLGNKHIRERQMMKLAAVKKGRDDQVVQARLAAIKNEMKQKRNNLLELAVEAARARATLGEISNALEQVVGRHTDTLSYVRGIYKMEWMYKHEREQVENEIKNYKERVGKKPSILLTKLGQDGHDRGIKVIAAGFADFGFDVRMGQLFQTPQEAAQLCVGENVDCVGVSTLAGGHRELIQQFVHHLNKIGKKDMLMIVGGVIPDEDVPYLNKLGVTTIFHPGTVVIEAVLEVIHKLNEQIRVEKGASYKEG